VYKDSNVTDPKTTNRQIKNGFLESFIS